MKLQVKQRNTKPIMESDSELEDEFKEIKVENSGGVKDGGGGMK